MPESLFFPPLPKSDFNTDGMNQWLQRQTISAQKLITGSLQASQIISSANFVTGVSGWQIDGDGNAEFNDVTVRGELTVSSGANFVFIGPDVGGVGFPGIEVHNDTWGQSVELYASTTSFVMESTGGSDGIFITSTGINLQTDNTVRIAVTDARTTLTNLLNLGDQTELTISGGAITATKSYHTVDTEADAATDNLDTINGGSTGDILILQTAVNTRDVTLKDGTGNLALAGDFVLDVITDKIMLIFVTTGWHEIARSSN